MPFELSSNFTIFDWCIVIVYLLMTVAIGIWANRSIRNMTDYLVAGRSLRSFLGVATMIGSELGLVTVMFASIGEIREVRMLVSNMSNSDEEAESDTSD